MRLLLDENVTRLLVPLLVGHEVLTVRSLGWAGRSNGELLKGMVDQNIKILVTLDKSLQYQLPLDRYSINLIVLRARKNDLAGLEPLVPKLLSYLEQNELVKVKEIS